MKIEDALSQCKRMNLKDWNLVFYVQKLVSQQMDYSSGKVHFKPLSKVHKWNGVVFISTYLISPLINKWWYRSIIRSVEKKIVP